MARPYYEGREAELADLFGATTATVTADELVLDGRRLRIVEDVIVSLPADRLPPSLRGSIGAAADAYAPDIQHTFGAEWTAHPDILDEHRREFAAYFDLVDLDGLRDARVADLGCGSGRWASFVAPHCRTLVAVDFSDAIFVTRRNLASHPSTIFVLGDVLDLPFRDDAFDFAYCLGVLHHLPVDALDACRRLAPLTPDLLVYLYYALDNRPAHFRALLGAVTAVRRVLAGVRDERARAALTWALALTVYLPLALVWRVADRFGAGNAVPLGDTYGRSTVKRMRQDVYDRFFTGIEQRFSRQQIRTLTDTFADVEISDGLPYWHFRCRRFPPG
jgi:SAM-dependent methyltransferase